MNPEYRKELELLVEEFFEALAEVDAAEETGVNLSIKFDDGCSFGRSVTKFKKEIVRSCNHTCCCED